MDGLGASIRTMYPLIRISLILFNLEHKVHFWARISTIRNTWLNGSWTHNAIVWLVGLAGLHLDMVDDRLDSTCYSSHMKIRKAIESDLNFISSLEALCWGTQGANKDDFSSLIQENPTVVFIYVLEDDNELRGFVGYSYDAKRSHVDIWNLAVSPKNRKRRYGIDLPPLTGGVITSRIC